MLTGHVTRMITVRICCIIIPFLFDNYQIFHPITRFLYGLIYRDTLGPPPFTRQRSMSPMMKKTVMERIAGRWLLKAADTCPKTSAPRIANTQRETMGDVSEIFYLLTTSTGYLI